MGATGAHTKSRRTHVSSLARPFQNRHRSTRRAAGISDLSPPPADKIERELDGVEKLNARLVAACEPDYPPLLAQLDAPPPLIAIRGDAAELGAAGFTVVSGLARGVDAAAHKGALATGTIAVLAGGLDHPYPPQNLKLHEAICERGAVIAEAPLGTIARARDFPRRNAIISGVSRGVGVIEAALRSGSLITARAAADQGRDVMAVPGSPLDTHARGSNALIKQGATLIESAEDVIAALGETTPARPLSAGPLFDDAIEAPPPSTKLQKQILDLLSPTPVHVNDLARLLDAPTGAVAAALTELELNGRAASLPGGYAASASASFS